MKSIVEEVEEARGERKIMLLGLSFGGLSEAKEKQLTLQERGKLSKTVSIELLKEKINSIQKKG